MSEPRQPKCSRCRHHGFIIRKKGHSGCCPFAGCGCWKCGLLTRRTRVNALQRNLSRTRTRDHPERRAGEPAAGSRDPESQQPDPGGEPGPGPDSGDVPSCGTPPPIMPHSSSTPPPPHLLLHLPYLPALPAGLYGDLHRSLMVPHFLQGVMSYPPPPPEDCRLIFFPLHPPPPPHLPHLPPASGHNYTA